MGIQRVDPKYVLSTPGGLGESLMVLFLVDNLTWTVTVPPSLKPGAYRKSPSPQLIIKLHFQPRCYPQSSATRSLLSTLPNNPNSILTARNSKSRDPVPPYPPHPNSSLSQESTNPTPPLKSTSGRTVKRRIRLLDLRIARSPLTKGAIRSTRRVELANNRLLRVSSSLAPRRQVVVRAVEVQVTMQVMVEATMQVAVEVRRRVQLASPRSVGHPLASGLYQPKTRVVLSRGTCFVNNTRSVSARTSPFPPLACPRRHTPPLESSGYHTSTVQIPSPASSFCQTYSLVCGLIGFMRLGFLYRFHHHTGLDGLFGSR